MTLNSIKCFRTVTRAGIFRQLQDASGVTFLVPIGIAVPPQSITINPGDSIDEPKELALDGTLVPSFTYTKERSPEAEMTYSMMTLEMESLIHGRVVAKIPAGGTVEGWIYQEFVANSTTPVPARPTNMLGNGVAALAADSKAEYYYIDPTTKLAKSLTIVAGAPATMNEIEVGASLAPTLHADLAATGYQVIGWIPNQFSAGTVLTATPLGLMSIFAQGISFDNKARMLTIRNCSRLPGGGVGADSTRQAKMRILPDPLDGTGLGYSIVDTPTLSVV